MQLTPVTPLMPVAKSVQRTPVTPLIKDTPLANVRQSTFMDELPSSL
jgi:hypothetical protein